MSQPGSGTDVRHTASAAVERGVAFLVRRQLASGEFEVLTSLDRTLMTGATPDPSIFPTALMAGSLCSVPGTGAILDKAFEFLLAQKDDQGLWRHWTRDHPNFRQLPPDIDDTSCVSAALAKGGREGASDRELILANRDNRGLFLTWFIPRLRWQGRKMLKVTVRQWINLPILYLFFKKTSAAPQDVDAGVNSNVLHYLGAFPGHERIVEHLVAILRGNREAHADKWYENRWVLWYLLSRALRPLTQEPRSMLLQRLSEFSPDNALELALSICISLDWERNPGDEAIARLLALQAEDGSWRRASVYFGGRERNRDGTLAPPHKDTPHWGSEELTTGFCLEALARWTAAVGA